MFKICTSLSKTLGQTSSFTPFTNLMSSKYHRFKDIAIISGSSGEVGRPVTKESIQNKKFDLVVALTSNKGVKKIKDLGIENEKLLIINRDNGPIGKQLKETLPKGADTVNLIHLVGGTPHGVTYAYTEEQLKKLNQDPAKQIVDSVGEFAIETKVDAVRAVNISSIAVSYLHGDSDCKYSQSRLESEQLFVGGVNKLQKHGIDVRSGSIRVGFVMQEPKKDPLTGQWFFDTGYEGGMHHQANLPFVVALGNGRQPVQPLHIRDLSEGAIKALTHDSLENGFAIDGVTTGNTVPFVEFISALHPEMLQDNGELNAILVPFEVAEIMAKFMSVGHLQCYAVNVGREQEKMMNLGQDATLSPDAFEKVLGRQGTHYLADFGPETAKHVKCVKPKYVELSTSVIKNLMMSPRAAYELVKALRTHGGNFGYVKVTR